MQKNHCPRSGLFVVALLVAAIQFIATAPAAELQVIPERLPAAAAQSALVGRLASETPLHLAIGLPLRNQAALSNLLQQIYNPESTNYHHYLTPEQFTERFGPTEADYQAVIAFATTNGLQVTATHPNRLLLDVSGTVATVERTLHVTMRTYQHPTENRTFFAPDTQPSLDLTIPVLHIGGLDNYSLPRPHFVTRPLVNGQNTSPNLGSGPGGTYRGNDFRTAYVPGTTLTGIGQIVGLLQFDGYTASDITYYETHAGLPNVPLQNVLLDGFSGNPSHTGGEVEVSLDIEMAISMAPGLSKVIVYEAPNPSPFEDILNRMVTDNLAKQLSCSWFIPNGPANPSADLIFQQMAAQGQSFFNASGDNDAYTGLISFPGDTPYITQVGGTTLTTSGPGGSWVSEKVWNWGNGIGSGGGISTQYPIPVWQTNISMTANQGSAIKRNTPDVALTADNIYVRADGQDHNVGGTSCAAPLWAGFAALVNQQAVAFGQPMIGFINPAVDAISSGPGYSSSFHDITTGNNARSGSAGKFVAVTGYDLCTGWGTPVGQGLINALANPEPLLIAPATGFTSSGGAGGPFTITSQSLSLTNSGTNTLTWSLSNTSLWLNASPAGGTLTPGGSAATVAVSLNSVASNLLVGTYTATIWFTNLNDNAGQGRQFILSVIAPPTITLQPTNQAVLDGATAMFTVGAAGGLPLAYQWQFNSNNLSDGGNISGATTTNLFVSNVSTSAVGTYTVVVTNIAGTVTSGNALLTLTPSAPVIITQPSNQTAIAGTTVQFSVTALGSKPFSYQWSLNTTNIDGATNATLTLNNVQLSQAGNYAVRVTNAIDSVLSSNALLTVVNVPVITSFSPQSGATGTVVNISGLNFSPVPSNNVVYFGAVKAVVSAANSTNLTVTVPVSATYAPITETVNGLTAYANRPFTPTFPGDGSGISASSFAPRLDLPAGNNAFRAVIVDLDGDAKPDLVVGNVFGSSISLYRNISTNGSLTAASFAPRVDLAAPSGALNPWDIAVADVDGDGKLDIIAVNSGANVISVYRNTCTPGNISSNSFAVRVDFPAGAQPQGVAVRDLDGDGRPDLLVANTGDGSVSIFRNTGITGSLTTNSFAPKIDIATGSICTGVAVGDLDGDGKPDVVTVNNGSATLSLLRNIGSPGNLSTNSFAPKVDFPLLATSVQVVIGDLDGDGKPDLTISSASSGQAVSVYRNVSTPGNFTTGSLATRVDFAAGGWDNGLALGDLDGDGKPDVALVSQASSQFSIFSNVSTPGSFTNSSLAARVDFSSGSNPNGIAIGDLDGDGRPEVVFCNQYDSTLSIYQNQAPFGLPPQFILQPTNTTVVLGATATFTVTANGSLPLSYQWTFNSTNISGATNASLSLTNVQFSQAGSYAVALSNRFNSILSSNALLIVNDKLDHFAWGQIPSPRFVNVPFNVVIQALDPANAIFTNFIGTVILSSTNGISINPPVSAAFVQGVWAGSITISQPATNLVLRADGGSGAFGLANPISLVNQPTLGFAPSGNFLLIYWPVASSNFTLETSFSLSPAQWLPTDPPLRIGDQYLESIQMNNSNQFFRLRFTAP